MYVADEVSVQKKAEKIEKLKLIPTKLKSHMKTDSRVQQLI